MGDVTVAVSLVELLFSGISALVAYFLWGYRDRPAGFPVLVMVVAATLYSLCNGLGTLIGNESVTLFLFHLRWPLGAVIAAGACYTGIEYTNQTRFQNPVVVGLLVVLILASTLVFMTNIFHEYALANVGVDPESGALVYETGPLLVAHLLLSFGVAFVGFGFLVGEFTQRTMYRRQTGVLIAGIGIGICFFVIESVVVLHPAFNLATLGLTAASIILLWAIVRGEFLQTVPVARETLMQSMDDYVIALNTENRVIDLNQSARELVSTDGTAVGKPIDIVFGDHPDLVEKLAADANPASERTEQPGKESDNAGEMTVSLTQDGETRYYDLNISPIEHQAGYRERNNEPEQLGRLVVVRDVTETRRREDELDLLKQVFARVLRHNIRNNLNIISGNAQLLSERTDAEHVGLAETIIEQSNHMIDLSEKARHLEKLIESPDEKLTFPLADIVEMAMKEVCQQYPDASMHVDIEEAISVQAHGALQVALENVLENACEHHPTETPTVEITGVRNGDRVQLRIEDDGPGIPQHEIEVIEQGAETKLEHGSGLGLWLVAWIINRSDGSVTIEATETGTCVEFDLQGREV